MSLSMETMIGSRYWPPVAKQAQDVVTFQADAGPHLVALLHPDTDVTQAQRLALADAVGLVLLEQVVPEGGVIGEAEDDGVVPGHVSPVAQLAGDEVLDVALFQVQGVDPFIPANVALACGTCGVDQPVAVNEESH